MKKLLILLILSLFSLFLLPTSIIASNNEAYMIITNPGENASSEMNISWHMPENITNGKLIYTTKDDKNWENAITINGTYETINIFKNRRVLKYSVTLTDLIQDTEYMYKVGANTFSDIHYFKTAGAEEFSFMWAGDWHAYLPIPNRTESITNLINKALELDPSLDFMFSTGDIVAYGSDYEAWKDLYSREQYKKFMWANTLGNHDALNNDGGLNSDNFFKAVNNNPQNGYQGQEGVSYYFKYGNTLFIVLNTEKMNSVKTRLDAQNWAAEVIKNNPSQYIFVSMHYHWFSGVTGSYFEYSNWRSFFDTHNVDLAMAGNNHVYVRTHRLYNNKVSTDPTKGTVYMQIPSSDNDRGNIMNETYENEEKIAKRWTEGIRTIGGVIVTVNKDHITTKLIDRNGVVQDEATIAAKRSLPNISNFDKAKFEEGFIYTSLGSNGVISCSVDGVGFVSKIEYLDVNNTLLLTNPFYKKEQASYVLNDFDDEFINVRIHYIDKSTSTIKLKKINDDFIKISNLQLTIIDSKYQLTWTYTGNDNNLKAWVFVDGVAIKEVKLSDLNTNLDDISLNSVIEIRADQNSLYSRNKTHYALYGDVDFNGVVNENDVIRLLNSISSDVELSEGEIRIADIDLDGEITLIDVSYIHLFTKENISSIIKKQYKVKFIDHLGKEIETKDVNATESIDAPTLDLPDGYEFIGWDKDTTYIIYDMVVRPIVVKVGVTNEE